MESLDQPDQRRESRQPDRVGAGDVHQPTPKSRELRAPDERGRVYEAMQAYVSAETARDASPGLRPEESEQRNYWSEVPEFHDTWAKHEKCWQERHAAAEPDSPADSAGSYRSKSGFKLSPERHAETVQAIGRMREAEPAISADIRTIEKENNCGGWLEGFDRRIKGDDRLKEKVAELAAVEPDASSSAILRKIPDALRFTYCFEPDDYTRGYHDIKARLEDLGNEMCQSTNYWTDPEYKGINARCVTAEGQRFEVQFHTPESFHAKHCVTHEAYERLRNPLIPNKERRELEDFQREVSSHVPVPDGAVDIPDFKKEGF